MAATAYRIVSPEGEHVETCKPDLVELALEHYNGRRELDIDGNPIGGEFIAVAVDAPGSWAL